MASISAVGQRAALTMTLAKNTSHRISLFPARDGIAFPAKVSPIRPMTLPTFMVQAVKPATCSRNLLA